MSLRAADTTALAVLVLLLGIGVTITWRTVRPPDVPAIDTRLESGNHLTFVFLAPTGAANEEYVQEVELAKSAMRRYARESGYHYSTVGVSDDWSIERGLAILAAFGTFDEVSVGRNWFNTGIQRYITEAGALAAIPQVVVFAQEADLETDPWTYGTPRELVRVIGAGGMEAWSRRQFVVPFFP